MLCQFLLYSKMNQPCLYIYPLPFEFPSHSVSCAIQQALSYLFYTEYQQQTCQFQSLSSVPITFDMDLCNCHLMILLHDFRVITIKIKWHFSNPCSEFFITFRRLKKKFSVQLPCLPFNLIYCPHCHEQFILYQLLKHIVLFHYCKPLQILVPLLRMSPSLSSLEIYLAFKILINLYYHQLRSPMEVLPTPEPFGCLFSIFLFSPICFSMQHVLTSPYLLIYQSVSPQNCNFLECQNRVYLPLLLLFSH